jgi:hypothetical protein
MKEETFKKFSHLANEKDLSLSAFAATIIAEKIKGTTSTDEPAKEASKEVCN